MLKELIDEIRKYQREEVAYKTGISIGTLNSLLCGRNTNPTIKTVIALQKFLEEKNHELSSDGEKANG